MTRSAQSRPLTDKPAELSRGAVQQLRRLGALEVAVRLMLPGEPDPCRGSWIISAATCQNTSTQYRLASGPSTRSSARDPAAARTAAYAVARADATSTARSAHRWRSALEGADRPAELHPGLEVTDGGIKAVRGRAGGLDGQHDAQQVLGPVGGAPHRGSGDIGDFTVACDRVWSRVPAG